MALSPWPTLGPLKNSFTAATQVLAEAARDAYAVANAAWLAQYDDEPIYLIEINWPVAVTDTVYQSRRSGAWAEITGIDAATTALAEAIGASESVAGRLGPVVAALVERYAEHAPDAVKDEAVIRSAGWLQRSRPGLRKIGISSFDIEYASGQSALRNSGSMSLLSPWKVRRAGRV